MWPDVDQHQFFHPGGLGHAGRAGGSALAGVLAIGVHYGLAICTVGSNLEFTFPLPGPYRAAGRDPAHSLLPSRSESATEPGRAHTTTAARKTACATNAQTKPSRGKPDARRVRRNISNKQLARQKLARQKKAKAQPSTKGQSDNPQVGQITETDSNIGQNPTTASTTASGETPVQKSLPLGNVPEREDAVPQVKPVAIRPRPRRRQRTNTKLQKTHAVEAARTAG